jgi:hypothetical protein
MARDYSGWVSPIDSTSGIILGFITKSMLSGLFQPKGNTGGVLLRMVPNIVGTVGSQGLMSTVAVIASRMAILA